MGLATDMGVRSGSPLPLAGAAESIYTEVVKRQPDLARKDFSSVYLFLRKAAEEGKKVQLGDVALS
jgi:3-hydroxyisobutyrate dehydrogenase